jgi:hypothetical protein
MMMADTVRNCARRRVVAIIVVCRTEVERRKEGSDSSRAEEKEARPDKRVPYLVAVHDCGQVCA